jgi:nucleotide-binding universal stress UspA family protein
VASLHREGFAVEEIIAAAEEFKVDLIVMGIKGSTSALNIFMGSTTTSVISRSSVPVLTIPENARYKHIENIVFAYDYGKAPNDAVTALLNSYAKQFSATLHVVNVISPDEILQPATALAGVEMDDALATVPHKLYFKESKDIVEELNTFITKHHSDLLVMIPHHHSFLSGLLHQSTSKQAAFRTHVPLLTVHD